MFVEAKLLTSVLIDDILYFKHILLSYKTRQMDKTQVINISNDNILQIQIT